MWRLSINSIHRLRNWQRERERWMYLMVLHVVDTVHSLQRKHGLLGGKDVWGEDRRERIHFWTQILLWRIFCCAKGYNSASPSRDIRHAHLRGEGSKSGNRSLHWEILDSAFPHWDSIWMPRGRHWERLPWWGRLVEELIEKEQSKETENGMLHFGERYSQNDKPEGQKKE